EQWFMKCTELGQLTMRAIDDGKIYSIIIICLHSGRIKLVPDFHKQNWREWITNSDEWCLSRQLIWGHRVPAWSYKSAFILIICIYLLLGMNGLSLKMKVMHVKWFLQNTTNGILI